MAKGSGSGTKTGGVRGANGGSSGTLHGGVRGANGGGGSGTFVGGIGRETSREVGSSSSNKGSSSSKGSSSGSSGSTLSGGNKSGENNPNSPNYRPDRYNEDGSMTDRYKSEYEAAENDRIMSEGGWGMGYSDPKTGKVTNTDPNYRKPNSYDDYEDYSYDYGNPYDEYLAAVEEQKKAQAAALKAQVDAAVSTLQGQKDVIGNRFNESASDAYIRSMLGKKNVEQQLAAQGITGGMTESSGVAMDAAYGNEYNNLQNAYNQGLSDIDRDIINTKATGDISIAQSAGQYEQMMAQTALEQQRAQQQAEQQYNQMLMQAQLEREQMEYQNQLKLQQMAAQQEYKESAAPRASGGAASVVDDQSPKKSNSVTGMTNGKGESWLYVAGMGRLSMQEAVDMVSRGEIVERRNSDGTVTYVKR